MAVQGILSKDLIPKVHDVWNNQRASEDKVLQNTSCMATFQSWVPCTSRHCCPQYCLPSIWTAWLASLAPYIACRVKSPQGHGDMPIWSPVHQDPCMWSPKTYPSTPNSLKPISEVLADCFWGSSSRGQSLLWTHALGTRDGQWMIAGVTMTQICGLGYQYTCVPCLWWGRQGPSRSNWEWAQMEADGSIYSLSTALHY